jgi:hypothetical protein
MALRAGVLKLSVMQSHGPDDSAATPTNVVGHGSWVGSLCCGRVSPPLAGAMSDSCSTGG